MRYFSGALRETLRQLGGVSGVVVLVGAAVIGWLLLGIISGGSVMAAEWPNVLSALSAVVVVAILFLIYNWVAAPFRAERAAALALAASYSEAKARIAALESEVGALREVRPRLRLTISQIAFGGTTEIAPPFMHGLMPFITVGNVGSRDTAVVGWRMWLEGPSGRDEIGMVPVEGEVDLFPNSGTASSYSSENLIYKFLDALQVGHTKGGALIGLYDSRQWPEKLAGISLVVGCQDIDGRDYEVSYPIKVTREGYMFRPEAQYLRPRTDDSK